MPHVNLLVAEELVDELPTVLSLLNADEVGRVPGDNGTTVVTLDMVYVPEDAEVIEPTFQRTPDGIRVQSIVWQLAGWDPDDNVQCWHIEPTTKCDWNICRQPERLVAGDYGTDPAAGAW